MTGTLIGMVGVGGVLLAPLLVYFLGMEIHPVMATYSWSCLFTGITARSLLLASELARRVLGVQ